MIRLMRTTGGRTRSSIQQNLSSNNPLNPYLIFAHGIHLYTNAIFTNHEPFETNLLLQLISVIRGKYYYIISSRER
jgi:hypothetical protein